MRIKVKSAGPCTTSVFPCLSFQLEIKYTQYQKALVGIEGWLLTDDEKIIADIKEYLNRESHTSHSIAAEGSSHDSQFREEICYTTVLALLDRRALNHIERRRMEERKRDVKLQLHLNVTSIDSKAVVLPLIPVKSEDLGLKPISVPTSRGESDGELLATTFDPNFNPAHNNQWVLSGKDTPQFLSIEKDEINTDYTIPSSDWIQDYAPELELGEYFIVEIPKGKKSIEEAWDYIDKAEESFRRCETKGAYANCREAGKSLDSIVKGKLGNDSFVYKERWGRTYKRVKNMSFNDLTSLDLHLEDLKKSYKPEDVKIGKTDAEHIILVTKALIKYAEELLHEGVIDKGDK